LWPLSVISESSNTPVLSSGAEVLWPRTKAVGVADAMSKALS